jgi:serine/threonine protein kinase/Tol biopolymer transport system component
LYSAHNLPLTAGARLGPYEILSPLGAGGMGEVYRARDTRLERDVAVKVLSSRLSASPESRQRFEREAKTVSQLSHPHICALYDVGREGETEYLVMELLEGETLSERLAKGPLPLEQTLRYGTEIADALDKAHRQGIVHRDLKPANVMITKSGVKLLDFGLAKAIAPAAKPSSVTELPTQQALTQEGTILGTFQYMAPEQLEGKDADARTDVFAFGAVLYEMASGKKAFAASSQASLITAIMSSDPPAISTVQPMSPPALDRVVKKCLAKDPEGRWQNAADLASELQWVGEGSQAGLPPQLSLRRKNRERLAWTAAILLFAGCAALLVRDLRRPGTARRLMRFGLAPPAGESFSGAFALSPDGRSLAFTSNGGDASLWIQSFDSGTMRKIAGTPNARYPFWSPDGKWVAVFTGGKLKKTDFSGATPQVVCDAGDTRGGSWGTNGQILFSPGSSGGLYAVSSAGGTPAPVTVVDVDKQQENSHRWPVWLPDGRHYLFLVMSGRPDVSGVYEGTVGSSTKKKILPDLSLVAFAPEGYLLFRRGALIAQRFDPERGELSGDPIVLVDRIQGDPGITGAAAFSVSDAGVLVYQAGTMSPTHLVWVDRTGKELSAVPESDNMTELALSPDQKRVVAQRGESAQNPSTNIWMLDLARGVSSRLTFEATDELSPVWSPDGARIAFSSSREGQYDVYEMGASGVGGQKLMLRAGAGVPMYPDDWSSDGKYIVCESSELRTAVNLWLLPLSGDRKPVPYLETPYNEGRGQFSPDAKWMAYVSDEGGIPQVFVQSVPISGGKWQISTDGGDQPAWRRDGKELFYLSPARKMMAVPVATGTNFEAGLPHALFDAPIPNVSFSGDRNLYVTADGQRFLLRKLLDDTAVSPSTIVLDWPAELKK